MKSAKRTMECSEAALRISERVDGEVISSQEDARLDTHLEVCSACSDLLRLEVERTRTLVRALDGSPESSERLVRAVLDGGAGAPGQEAGRVLRPRFRLLVSVAGLAAAAVVAVSLGTALDVRRGGPADETPRNGSVALGPQPAVGALELEVPGEGKRIVRTPQPVTGPLELEIRRDISHPGLVPAADGTALQRFTTERRKTGQLLVPSRDPGRSARLQFEIEGLEERYDPVRSPYR